MSSPSRRLCIRLHGMFEPCTSTSCSCQKQLKCHGCSPRRVLQRKGTSCGKVSRILSCCLSLLWEVFGEWKICSQSTSEPCQSLLLAQAGGVVAAQVWIGAAFSSCCFVPRLGTVPRHPQKANRLNSPEFGTVAWRLCLRALLVLNSNFPVMWTQHCLTLQIPLSWL